MRSIWSGAISFGLVYIPVRLYSATQDSSLDFDMLRRGDLCPISYVRVCRETGEEVPWEDIVKGYEYEKGRYVVLEDEDFKRASVEKTRTITLVNFIDEDEIDIKYLEKPYFLEPEAGAAKVYALLREALQRSGKVGVARFVLRTREHLAVLKPQGDVLILNVVRFAQEIRPTDELDLPGEEQISEAEMDVAVQLIDQLSRSWDPQQYEDTYTEDLKRIIQEKVSGKEFEPVEEEPIPYEVTDLFAQLKASLEEAKQENAS